MFAFKKQSVRLRKDYSKFYKKTKQESLIFAATKKCAVIIMKYN